MPLAELKKRLAELPKDLPVVAYCRGPFCLTARDAVELLRKKGYRAFHLTDGVAEWRARGLPLEEST
jgi:rhodanese-related sulfurtransferase